MRRLKPIRFGLEFLSCGFGGVPSSISVGASLQTVSGSLFGWGLEH